MRSRQLYSSITATSTGTIYFDVPDNTTVRSVSFAVNASVVGASADYLELECSLSSANQTAVSDAQGVLAVASFCNSGTGAAANLQSVNLNHTVPCNIPVRKGERIYLNATESGTTTWRTRVLVWFD